MNLFRRIVLMRRCLDILLKAKRDKSYLSNIGRDFTCKILGFKGKKEIDFYRKCFDEDDIHYGYSGHFIILSGSNFRKVRIKAIKRLFRRLLLEYN